MLGCLFFCVFALHAKLLAAHKASASAGAGTMPYVTFLAGAAAPLLLRAAAMRALRRRPPDPHRSHFPPPLPVQESGNRFKSSVSSMFFALIFSQLCLALVVSPLVHLSLSSLSPPSCSPPLSVCYSAPTGVHNYNNLKPLEHFRVISTPENRSERSDNKNNKRRVRVAGRRR